MDEVRMELGQSGHDRLIGQMPCGCSESAAPHPCGVSEPVLSLANVTHRFGNLLAVDGASVDLHPGEIVCLLGPSGCGKSTLLRLAAGLEDIQAGMVRIGGLPVAEPGRSIPPEQRGIGLVFQDYALFPHLSVLANVKFGIRGLPAADQRARAHETLAQVGMTAFAQAFPHELSGGQQQRVALARALAPRPSVLLLDEPFSGLDVCLRHQIRQETLDVLRRQRAAVLIVTHDPEEAMYLSDRIVLMREGRIIQTGTPAQLYLNPVDSFAACFLGDANRIGGAVRQGAVETVFGHLPATAACECCHGEDAPVDVLVRPEGIRLLPPDSADTARPRALVTATRLLGRTSLVQMRMHDRSGAPIYVEARVAGPNLPAVGSAVALAVDPRQIFVFPRLGC